jgi:uncharacterized protein
VYLLAVEEIRIVETTPIEKVDHCLVGFPDVGLVGLIAVNHIVNALGLADVGYIESDYLPPVVVVHQGDPKAPIRVYRKEGLIIITSEVPIQPAVIPFLSRRIVDWAKTKGSQLLITLSGVAVQNRLEIETPAVYGVGGSPGTRDLLKKSAVNLLEEGFMVGAQASIMRESVKANVPSVILMAQSHSQYPDPGAAASIVSALNRLLNLNVDVKGLLEQAEEIRLRMRELMQRTSKSMRGMEKGQEQELPAMYV